MVVFLLFIGLPLLGWWLFTSIFDALVPKETYEEEKPSKTTYVNHNYITENHLHISKEDLAALNENKSSKQ